MLIRTITKEVEFDEQVVCYRELTITVHSIHVAEPTWSVDAFFVVAVVVVDISIVNSIPITPPSKLNE